MKELLSKKAIRVLENNGYKFVYKNHLITFKRATDYIGIIVIGFITLFFGGTLMIFSSFLGYLTFVLGIGGIIVRQRYFSKKMNFAANLKTQKFDFFDNAIELEHQSLSYTSKIIIHSRFVDEYTSSFKTTSEEHEISIRIELLSGSMFTLFRFQSDHAKPSDEIMEIYKFMKKLIRWTKRKRAQSTGQTD